MSGEGEESLKVDLRYFWELDIREGSNDHSLIESFGYSKELRAVKKE